MLSTRVNIFEIFKSINGEVTASHQGSICTFVRLAGCNFNASPCTWCDTSKALNLSSGKSMFIGDVLKKVKELGCRNITLTGGEPLYQKSVNDLIVSLAEFGYDVSLETNGSISIDNNTIDYLHCIVADYKLPSSGCENKMNWNLFKKLRSFDFIKMAIANEEDLVRAGQVYSIMKGADIQAQFAFSPVILGEDSKITLKDIFNYLISQSINDAVINIQIHKFFNFE